MYRAYEVGRIEIKEDDDMYGIIYEGWKEEVEFRVSSPNETEKLNRLKNFHDKVREYYKDTIGDRLFSIVASISRKSKNAERFALPKMVLPIYAVDKDDKHVIPYSTKYDKQLEQFYIMMNEKPWFPVNALKDWLRGEKYIIPEGADETDSDILWKLSRNYMIDKTLSMMSEIDEIMSDTNYNWYQSNLSEELILELYSKNYIDLANNQP